jgi:polar amino acid transport system substrate-binding protein
MTRIKSTRRAALLAFSAMLAYGSVQAIELKLARNENLVEQYVAAKLLIDIYRRAGLTATIIALPPARATKTALSGEVDGEVARIASYSPKHTGLVMVEPAYYQLQTTAFVRINNPLVFRTPEDLKRYRVAIIRGVAHSADATQGHPDVQVVSAAPSLFKMLDAGRVDVALDTKINGAYLQRKLELGTIQSGGDIATQPLYHVLGPNKAVLAPQISKAISELKKSGELERLARHYEEEFLRSGLDP